MTHNPEPEARTLTLDQLAARLDYQARKQGPTQNMHGVHVGDIFYSTWGYDQTNVDFWQVVELKGTQTAIIREIHAEISRNTGSMSGYKWPRRDDFYGNKLHTVRTRLTKYRPNNPVVIRRPGALDEDMMRCGDDEEQEFSSWA